MSPKKLLDNSLKDIRLVIIQNYFSPEKRVVQGAGEFDDNFLARLTEESRYCDIQTLKTVTNPEEDLVIGHFISILRDLEAK